MKKNYQSPHIRIVKILPQTMIASSPVSINFGSNNYNGSDEILSKDDDEYSDYLW